MSKQLMRLIHAVSIGEKTKGRKRFIVVDLQGHILACKVIAASIHDTKGGFQVAQNATSVYPTIEKFSADDGYRGTFVIQVNQFLKREVEISMKIKSQGFHVIKERWVVERTFTWLNNSRRLSKDYEITTWSAESFILISHFHTLLNRL